MVGNIILSDVYDSEQLLNIDKDATEIIGK